MLTDIRPFRWYDNMWTSVTAGVAPQNITFSVTLPRNANAMRTMRISTYGCTDQVWLRFDANAGANAGIPVLPNTVETFAVPGDVTLVSIASATAAQPVFIVMGESA